MFDYAVEDNLTFVSSPDLVDELRAAEREVSRHRARQIRLLRELRRRSIASSSPSASTVASQLDVSPASARALLRTAERTPERSQWMEHLESGEWSFDRAEAMARLRAAGADTSTIEDASDRDIAGIDKLRARTNRVRCRDERQAHEERYVRAYPSLDESVGFINAQLGGYEWKVVSRALDERADRFPRDARDSTLEQRRADALFAIAQDWLGGVPGRGATGPIVTVMVDADAAAQSDCEAGVTITGGPRAGPETLDRMMCEGSVEIVLDPTFGTPLAVGPTTRVVPPKVRRFVLNRDGGCVIAGCGSTYRLEVHHVVPRSQGGSHDVENLVCLCWYHHHIAIHMNGHRIDPKSPPRRRELIPPGRDPPRG